MSNHRTLKVWKDSRALVVGGTHLNGRADLGDGSGMCTACHGGPAGPAPPGDLLRRTDISAIGVGTHQAHLTVALWYLRHRPGEEATSRIREGIRCFNLSHGNTTGYQ